MTVTEGTSPVEGCLFCGIVAGSVPSATVAEDDTTVAFMDIDPGTDGSLLVIPKRHNPDLLEIGRDRLELPYQPGVPGDPAVLAARAGVIADALSGPEPV